MHTQSNLRLEVRRNPNFKPPVTKEEFSRLGYSERKQLQEEYPEIYRKFTNPKPWE